jgi:2-polyprenyl-3-methyl-5-hydroxy-6-metoxy-1,4-benzoquinol methylase
VTAAPRPPRPSSPPDPSNGWDAAADTLIRDRSHTVGVAVLRDWARPLAPGASVLDLGCGAGVPVSQTLVDLGVRLSAIDASPRLVDVYRRRFPHVEVACEPAETSSWFRRRFDALVSIGMMFFLDEAAQRAVIRRCGERVRPGGHVLISAPWQTATWSDPTTGRWCRSLGRREYLAAFARAGLDVVAMPVDEGGNHHLAAVCRLPGGRRRGDPRAE